LQNPCGIRKNLNNSRLWTNQRIDREAVGIGVPTTGTIADGLTRRGDIDGPRRSEIGDYEKTMRTREFDVYVIIRLNFVTRASKSGCLRLEGEFPRSAMCLAVTGECEIGGVRNETDERRGRAPWE
jgi:hypothetical protein